MPLDDSARPQDAASIRVPYDSGYKLLFSNAQLVRDLLTGFVKPAWLDDVDLSTLEPYKSSFVSDHLQQRHNDCIWRVRFGDIWIYLYLMIEFQSSDEHFMAVRIVTYTGLLYQDIIRSMGLKKGDKLPPVLPIVIYNGSEKWSGPHEVAELIDPVHPALADFSPRMRYFFLHEAAVAPDYTEQHPGNLMGHLIALGQCRDPYQMRDCIVRLQQQLADPQYKQIRQTFSIWLSRLLRARFRNDAIPEQHDLEEVNAMLAQNLEQWMHDFEAHSKAKGRAEGKAEGRVDGERDLLLKQIKLKFGAIPAWAQAQLDHATPAQLDVWGERILSADSLEALLAD